ncbi:alpha-aspartyl dipeptidase-like [Daphnia pulicaria]|uniref:alpha-aspartyl dipeptidase-like n=1 Tax=Daphnia pulicaria TaxID=35523 RepID=UPI001EEBFF8C|nr:alpha-aspartyl dipeptidase-like [Daphnia pulicaria]XP_046646468.1 alpha-aspartyl dipeptidase-like [Daphnia pulicaria]
MRKLLLLSTSVLQNGKYLDYASDVIKAFFAENGVSKIVFIPYAAHDHDAYEKKVKDAFLEFGLELNSIHKSDNLLATVKEAQGFFVGGGNTFLLLKTLYELNLLEAIKSRVLQDGIPYMGSSAGTNLATINICTTNDMPIVHPPTLDAFGFLPFNINPHYLDHDPTSKHMGESRETRLSEYHGIPNAKSPPVLGLREGSWLQVKDDQILLKGSIPNQTARLFVRGQQTKEHEVNSDLSFLLKI